MSEPIAADEPARPAEVNLAIGGLALLGLQQIHEGYYYLFGGRSPGLSQLHSAWVILLILFVGLAAGLWHRSRAAWWLTVGLVGLVAVIHLIESRQIIRLSYQPRPPAPPGMMVCSQGGTVAPFTILWLIAKSALLLAVPSLLLLGRFRQALAR